MGVFQFDDGLCQARRADKSAGGAQAMQQGVRCRTVRFAQDLLALRGKLGQHQGAHRLHRLVAPTQGTQGCGIVPDRKRRHGLPWRYFGNNGSCVVHQGCECATQVLQRHRLGEHGIETLASQLLVQLESIIGGQDQCRGIGAGVLVMVANRAQELKPIDVGEVQIQQQHIEAPFDGGGGGRLAKCESLDSPTQGIESIAEEGRTDRIVFAKQGALHGCSLRQRYAGSMKGAFHCCKSIGHMGAAMAAWLVLMALSLPLAPAQARVLSIGIDRIATPVASLQDVKISLDWPQDAFSGKLKLSAKALDASEFGYRWQQLDWRCTLKRQVDVWQCQGPIKARSASGMKLSARWQPDGLVIEASSDQARVQFDAGFESTQPFRLQLIQVPAQWLAPLLAAAWPEGHPTAGTLDLDWQLRTQAEGLNVAGPITLSGLGVDSRDGSIAAAGVNAAGKVQGELGDAATRLDVGMELQGGELLFGPVYVVLPKAPVQVSARLGSASNNHWRVDDLRWNDTGVAALQGSMDLDFSAPMPLRQADLSVDMPALEPAHARYLDSLAASIGLSKLALDGAACVGMTWRDGQWQTLDLSLQQVKVRDGAQRFAAEGLNGTLRVARSDLAVDSELSWETAQLYGLDLGAAKVPLRSVGAGVSLRSPVSIPFLDGSVQIKLLDYAPTSQDARFDMALALDQVNLAALSTALGWPAFAGSLSGDLPSVHYLDGRVDFDGGLSAKVFDGQVAVSQLSMERAFGVAPMLAASIEFSGLDLAPLTGAFGFGEITGRLDGHIRNLRLLDWQPVAFDAAFNTVKRRDVKRRISQRAVHDLTEVGGGGIAAGLQNQVLKAFSNFGYARIGLSCVLADDVCRMGGVGPAAKGGYTIVEGAGLPQVNVIGHQQRVDWPVLVARLKAATEGQMPVID